MDIEVIETIHDTYQLFDGDRFLADCGKGLEGEERAKDVWDEIKNLQLACDALRAERDSLHRAILDYISAVQTGQGKSRIDYCWRVMYGYVLAPTDRREGG